MFRRSTSTTIMEERAHSLKKWKKSCRTGTLPHITCLHLSRTACLIVLRTTQQPCVWHIAHSLVVVHVRTRIAYEILSTEKTYVNNLLLTITVCQCKSHSYAAWWWEDDNSACILTQRVNTELLVAVANQCRNRRWNSETESHRIKYVHGSLSQGAPTSGISQFLFFFVQFFVI
jgi:hypothetical protein